MSVMLLYFCDDDITLAAACKRSDFSDVAYCRFCRQTSFGDTVGEYRCDPSEKCDGKRFDSSKTFHRTKSGNAATGKAT
jgi:hypothetical protein